MAWELGDGLDFYNAVADMTAGGTAWSSVSGGGFVAAANTRFGVGQGFSVPGNGAGSLVTQTFGNDTTIYVNFTWTYPGTLPNNTTAYFGIAPRDTTNTQVGIYMRGDGSIIVTNGAFNGTILATWTGVFAGNVWNHYQFKIVINNTTGSVELRLNGATSDTQSLTGVNTRNGSANSYANNISIFGNAANTYFDDFYVFNDQGAQPMDSELRQQQLLAGVRSSRRWRHHLRFHQHDKQRRSLRHGGSFNDAERDHQRSAKELHPYG